MTSNHDHHHDHEHGSHCNHSHDHSHAPSSEHEDPFSSKDTANEGSKDKQSLVISLFNAIRYGLKAQVTSILTDNSGLANELDGNGCSVIHWAAKRGDVEMLEILHGFGANINIAASTDAKMRPIHWAASEGKVSSIAFFLRHREDINTQDANGCTPVIISTQHNYHQCVAYLIQNGADMSLRDNNGDTALHWAAYKGYIEMVGLLAYLTPRDLDSIDQFGQTPLHLAALRGNHDAVEYLARECKADMRIKDRNGSSPLDLSVKKSQLKSEWILRQVSEPTCLGLIRGLPTQKLKDQRILKYLFCGFDNREIGNWPWRIVFLSNFVASIITIMFAMDSVLADYYYLHLFNTMSQMLWWIMFTMCLFKSPSYVIDGPSVINCTNNSTVKNLYTYESILQEYGKCESLERFNQLPKVCHTCHICKPLRSKHCQVQRRCINKFDHFCPFVGNTVCRDNYKYFIGLLIMHVIAGLAWYSTVVILAFRVTISWQFFFYILYSLGWFGMIVMLLSYHLDLIRQGLSTNEHIKAMSYDYLKDKNGHFHNPFNQGSFFNNFYDAMFPSQKVYYNRDEYLSDKLRTKNGQNVGNGNQNCKNKSSIKSSSNSLIDPEEESKESLLESGNSSNKKV